MRRRQLSHVLEHAARRRDQPQSQVFVERGQIRLSKPRINSEERLDLRTKQQVAVSLDIVKRFLSEAITSREESLVSPIPYREGKHSAQMLHTVHTVLFVQVQDRFGVGICLE